MKFAKGQIIKLKDGSEWIVERITDTSKIKDKFYQKLNRSFNGSRFNYHLYCEKTGSHILRSQKQILSYL